MANLKQMILNSYLPAAEKERLIDRAAQIDRECDEAYARRDQRDDERFAEMLPSLSPAGRSRVLELARKSGHDPLSPG